MEITNSLGENHEVLGFPKGKAEITDGGIHNIFFKVKCEPEDIGDVLEDIVTIVFAQDAKDRGFDEQNTKEYIRMNGSFVKASLPDILKFDMRGNSVRLAAKPVVDGSYEVVLATNMDSRALLPTNDTGSPTFKEWFLNAAKNYNNKN
jgi:hypothetical protein